MKLKILIYEAEEGGYWAEVPALRGCVSEGETLDETLMNMKEAALGWLETASERHQPNMRWVKRANRNLSRKQKHSNNRHRARLELGCVDILFLGDDHGNKTEKIELATVPVSQTESISCDTDD